MGSQSAGSRVARAPRLEHRAPQRRRIDDDDLDGARQKCQANADADGTRPMDRHGLASLQPAPICGMPGHRERLDQRALHSCHSGRQTMHHGTTDDGEFRKSAAAAVIAVQCNDGTVVVLSGVAPVAMATGLEGFHRHQISGRQILDAGAEGHDHAGKLMAEYDGVLDPGERMRRGAGGQRPIVIFV
jgi:hypothetical protein